MGEIVFRGNIVMKEYFKDPEATRKAFRGGHFNSGDLAVWHPDGYIAIMDRSKDIIISGGENASSLAIEQGWCLGACLRRQGPHARTLTFPRQIVLRGRMALC